MFYIHIFGTLKSFKEMQKDCLTGGATRRGQVFEDKAQGVRYEASCLEGSSGLEVGF